MAKIPQIAPLPQSATPEEIEADLNAIRNRLRAWKSFHGKMAFIGAAVVALSLGGFSLTILPGCEFLDRIVHPHFGCEIDPITGEVVCYLDVHPPHDEEPVE